MTRLEDFKDSLSNTRDLFEACQAAVVQSIELFNDIFAHPTTMSHIVRVLYEYLPEEQQMAILEEVRAMYKEVTANVSN